MLGSVVLLTILLMLPPLTATLGLTDGKPATLALEACKLKALPTTLPAGGIGVGAVIMTGV